MTIADIIEQVELIVLLALAGALGAVIGAQREIHGAPAGMRTHLLVAFGSAMFTLVSAYGFTGLVGPAGGATNYDPTRIAAQVVAGIGFLGAGAIIKEGATIRGLTTAASLWTAAAIGMAVGAREVVLAIAGTVMMLVSLGPLGTVSARLRRRATIHMRASIRLTSYQAVETVLARLDKLGVFVANVSTSTLEDDTSEVELEIDCPAGVSPSSVMSVILGSEGVLGADTTALDDRA